MIPKRWIPRRPTAAHRLARLAVSVRLGGAILLAATPGAAHAQDKRLTSRLDAETAAAVDRLVDSVRALGLPSDALVGVALEGASRRATSDRIVTAVREYATALGVARQTLGDAATSDEIVSAAGVFVAGVAPRVVGSYRAARPSGAWSRS